MKKAVFCVSPDWQRALRLKPPNLHSVRMLDRSRCPRREYSAYNACASATSAAAKAPACESYLTAYPQSAVKADVLQQLMIAYSQIPSN